MVAATASVLQHCHHEHAHFFRFQHDCHELHVSFEFFFTKTKKIRAAKRIGWFAALFCSALISVWLLVARCPALLFAHHAVVHAELPSIQLFGVRARWHHILTDTYKNTKFQIYVKIYFQGDRYLRLGPSH